MSNIIKSYSIQYEPNSKITIDYKDKYEEIQAKLLNKTAKPHIDEEFHLGLEAEVVDAISIEDEQREKAEAIVDKAKKQAADILEEAKVEASKLKETTLREAMTKGYEDGINKGNQEIEQIKSKLKESERQQKAEYQSMLEGVEGQVSEIIASLITKLTGILVEDKMDIINYLVEKTLLKNNELESYTIRVSDEDFNALSSKKKHIEEIVGKEIQIISDTALSKNQCLIETENKIIDCSLDVQLNNLITDIRMLSSL